MQQLILRTRPVSEPLRTRLAIVCSLCSREIIRGDCGTPHRLGSAQMMYKRMPV